MDSRIVRKTLGLNFEPFPCLKIEFLDPNPGVNVMFLIVFNEKHP